MRHYAPHTCSGAQFEHMHMYPPGTKKHEATELFPTPDGKYISTFLVLQNSLRHMQANGSVILQHPQITYSHLLNLLQISVRVDHTHTSRVIQAWLGLATRRQIYSLRKRSFYIEALEAPQPRKRSQAAGGGVVPPARSCVLWYACN